MSPIRLKEVSKNALFGTIAFFLTFVLGSIIDLGFHKLYTTIDKDEQNEILLFIIFFVQMYVIVFIVGLLNQNNKMNPTILYFLRMGFIVSQIFVLHFVLRRISDKINGRDPSKRLYSLKHVLT